MKKNDQNNLSDKKIVPINIETVEFTSGLIGGFVGYIVGGTTFGFAGAAVTNYLSKSDFEFGCVVQAISKSFLHMYNFFVALDSELHIISKAKTLLENFFVDIKVFGNLDSKTTSKIKSTFSSIIMTIRCSNNKQNFISSFLTILNLVGDLVEKVVGTAVDINDDYRLTERAVDLIKNTVIRAQKNIRDSMAFLIFD